MIIRDVKFASGIKNIKKTNFKTIGVWVKTKINIGNMVYNRKPFIMNGTCIFLSITFSPKL